MTTFSSMIREFRYSCVLQQSYVHVTLHYIKKISIYFHKIYHAVLSLWSLLNLVSTFIIYNSHGFFSSYNSGPFFRPVAYTSLRPTMKSVLRLCITEQHRLLPPRRTFAEHWPRSHMNRTIFLDRTCSMKASNFAYTHSNRHTNVHTQTPTTHTITPTKKQTQRFQST